MTTKIRWGILATGAIAANFTEDLLTLTDAEVAAVGSRTPDSAKAFADRYGIRRAHGSWADLAADPDIDIVYVATPHSAHHAAAALCLDSGKAVLCEKPLTLDTAQAEDLVRRAGERGVFFMEAMWTRFLPAIQRMTELIGSGAIGDPRLVAADFSGVMAEDDPKHRIRNPDLGGGALLDLGVYPLTFSRLVLGEPSGITATATLTPQGVDDTTVVTLTHPGGALATVTCSISADGPWTATVAGTRGRIEIPRPLLSPSGFTLIRDGETTRIDAPYLARGMVHEAVEAQRCLREGLLESPVMPWSESLSMMRTMDEVRRQIGVTYPGLDG